MKKGTIILFAFGIVYIFIAALSLDKQIKVSAQMVFAVSIFAFFISLADLIESVSKLIINSYLSDEKNFKIALVLNTIVDNLIAVLYIIAVFLLISIPLINEKTPDKITLSSDSFSILSFAMIFLSIAFRDFGADIQADNSINTSKKGR